MKKPIIELHTFDCNAVAGKTLPYEELKEIVEEGVQTLYFREFKKGDGTPISLQETHVAYVGLCSAFNSWN